MRPINRDMNNFWTPDYIFDYAGEISGNPDNDFKFDLDVCADAENAKCEKYYTIDDNAIFQNWDKFNFCNPPYSNIEPFVDKAIFEARKGNHTCMLLPSRTSNPYWKKIFDNANVLFIGGRLSFGGHNNVKGSCAAEGSAYVFFYPETVQRDMETVWKNEVGWIHKKVIRGDLI
ncbi:MAG: DNA N-6-adenine-methyltransferase [Circular genetic element sp.]|nr:MAG: DNA N-6-adenine-methyltransferase [Circular genetic element sp.]|tara:strand:- start:908 stop:1429 length:522 start_codon:yes stop_codon:yes gene_type:complete